MAKLHRSPSPSTVGRENKGRRRGAQFWWRSGGGGPADNRTKRMTIIWGSGVSREMQNFPEMEEAKEGEGEDVGIN
jgi:hypothetical protein